MSTLYVANLGGEADLARRLGGRRVVLPESARKTAAALATLLRAFLDEGDILWTPWPVDPARMADVPGLPRPRLASGPVEEIDHDGPVRWWLPDSDLLARVNHRGFALATADALGVRLPGAKLLHSLHALDRHLEEGGASHAPGEAWVLKLPLSTAGRDRVFGRGRRPDEATEKRAANLLTDQGAFVFEPWVERFEDYGTTGAVGDDGPGELVPHRLEVTPDGKFRGIVLEAPDAGREELVRVARACGEALHSEGYRGPYGVDAFRYRDAAGRERLNPLAEINARTTFGHVARRLAERLSLPAGAALRTGEAPPGARSIPLIDSGNDDRTTAHLAYPRA